jgi:hypothetical protein
MNHGKYTPREDYRQQENRRTQLSASLATKFRELKSLTVEFGYFSPEGVARNRQIKYTVNPAHAKSVFRLDCQTVATRQATATGEMCCQGWLSKATIDRIQCRNILRYKLSLEYEIGVPTENNPTAVPLTSSAKQHQAGSNSFREIEAAKVGNPVTVR